MKSVARIIGIGLILVGIFYAFNSYIYNEKQAGDTEDTSQISPVTVTPISHATAVLNWDGSVIYTDPTGGKEAFIGQLPPSIVVVTDVHGDHLNADTLTAVLASATLIVPQAVYDLLPDALKAKAKILDNGETITEQGFNILAMPMYNLPESPESRHTKGRGNGYVIEKEGFRVYVAGDTAGIPEMRALSDIDMAFVPMNLPFTMGVEEAASAVLDFKPRQVYPFHYRGENGLADTNHFKELVNAVDPNIEVVLLDWYPEE